jgi:hypothetical protein
MDDLPDASHVADTACSLCGGPLGEDSYVFEDEGGGLMPVCSTCATADPPADEPPAPEEPGHETADAVQEALALLEGMIASRGREADELRGLATLVANLSRQLELWHGRADGLRERYRTLENELGRTVEHLRSTERLLALGSPLSNRAEDGIAMPAAPAAVEPVQSPASAGPRLTLDQVRMVQRYWNESKSIDKIRSVRRSLGKPLVCLTAVAGIEPRVMLTVAWEIVWYQYLVLLEEGLPPDERVTAFAEGMELTELASVYKIRNASIDDSGRVDASEMEVGLLAEGTELLTDMSPERAAAIDDATEEIWDQHSKPEFRWDD